MASFDHLLLGVVIEQTKELWEECPDDFCIQTKDIFNGVIVFGGVNRVVWSVRRGFLIDLSYCTPKFIIHYKKIMGVKT